MQVLAARQALAAREIIPYVEYVHKPYCAVTPYQREWADLFMHPSRSKPHTLIIAPPDSGKTSWTTKFLPLFLCGRNPASHVGIIASTAARAWKLSLAIRDTITGIPEFGEVFPDVKPNTEKGWARAAWFLDRPRRDDPDPTVNTCGLGGDILGARLDYLFLDDCFDEETVYSETMRSAGRRWIRNTAMSRVDKVRGHVFAILTRWSGVTEDLVAEFEHDPYWQIVRMPALNYYGDGGSLWPERIPLELLLAEQERDPLGFEAVYQGNPSLAEGDIFKRAWWHWMDLDVWPNKFEQVIQVWDTAYKKGRKNDFSACVTLGILRGNVFVMHVLREKLDWPNLMKTAAQQYAAFKPRVVLVEDSASGISLIQAIKAQSDPMIPVQESVRGQQDKRAFVNPISGFVQSGRVILPKDVKWTQLLVSECANFNPDREQHDDIVMSFAHGMRWLTKTKAVALTDDNIVVVGSPGNTDSGGIGVRLANTLGMGPSGMTMGGLGTGGGHWLDNM